MTASFRTIATVMDPVNPPTSLRELIDIRHRWAPNQRPSFPSFRTIANRHSGLGSTKHRFLSYNTFLLPGINIEFQLADLLAALELTAAQAVIKLFYAGALTISQIIAHSGKDSVQAIADLIGVDETKSFLGISWKDIIEVPITVVLLGGEAAAVLWIFEKLATMSAVEKISKLLEKAEKTAAEVLDAIFVDIVKVMAWIVVSPLQLLIALNFTVPRLLLHLFGVNIPDLLKLGAKPAIEARADAIGQMCAESGYDIIAFSEVWDQSPDTDDVRNRILQGWNGTSHTVHSARGPEKDVGSGALLDSGLFRITLDGRPIQSSEYLTFENRGNKLLDTDAWASKGVFLTRINLGVGILDLYNTHLISGADLLGSMLGNVIPQLKALENFPNIIRIQQMQELVEFVAQSSDPSHVVIICGDTNIEADKTNEKGKLVVDGNGNPVPAETYTSLKEKLSDYDDVWEDQLHFTPAQIDTLGYTHGPENPSDQVPGPDRFQYVCHMIADSANPNNQYCDEHQQPTHFDSRRIDYVFIQKPTEGHSFNLDCSRMRRRPFKHDGLPDDQLYLSDHIGLDLLLIASAR